MHGLAVTQSDAGVWIGYFLLIVAAVIVVWAAWSPDPRLLNLLVAVTGATLGWIVGILLSPEAGEGQSFHLLLTGLSSLVSGYVLARLDAAIRDSVGKQTGEHLIRGLLLFVCGFMLGSLTTFIWRHYVVPPAAAAKPAVSAPPASTDAPASARKWHPGELHLTLSI